MEKFLLEIKDMLYNILNVMQQVNKSLKSKEFQPYDQDSIKEFHTLTQKQHELMSLFFGEKNRIKSSILSQKSDKKFITEYVILLESVQELSTENLKLIHSQEKTLKNLYKVLGDRDGIFFKGLTYGKNKKIHLSNYSHKLDSIV